MRDESITTAEELHAAVDTARDLDGYEAEVVSAFVDRLGERIDERVSQQIDRRIGETAERQHSDQWPGAAVALISLLLGALSTITLSTTQVLPLLIIWGGIGLVNIAYFQRRS